MEKASIASSSNSIASARKTPRLAELDALRGVAAVLVMFFHFTTRYDQLFEHASSPLFSLPWGHYGVNLFFMISGFVIFLTLHRIQQPMDFLVSRFSRLYPAFWVAVLVTFLLTHWLELPGKTVGFGTAVLNFLMFHGLFKIPSVDGVYWTLEIELLFYFWAIVVYRIGLLDRIHSALLLLFAMRLGYFVANKFWGIEFSYTLSHLLILPYIAWFGCGIMIYRRTYLPSQSPRLDLLVLISAWLLLAIVEGVGTGFLAMGLSVLLYFTALGRLPVLANPVLVWLGAISYTLYLLHENIGWGVILQAQRYGIEVNISIALAIVISLAMATLLSRLVERPAMRWIRDRYKQHLSRREQMGGAK